MIITRPGLYPIIPITGYNHLGNPYQVVMAEITEIDEENQKVYCPDLGWIGWDVAMVGERGKK